MDFTIRNPVPLLVTWISPDSYESASSGVNRKKSLIIEPQRTDGKHGSIFTQPGCFAKANTVDVSHIVSLIESIVTVKMRVCPSTTSSMLLVAMGRQF
jgi:hypothetical protein